jgi:hypothetical protein
MLLFTLLYMFYTFCTTVWKHVYATLFFARKTLFFALFLHSVCTVHTTHILGMVVTHSQMLYSTSSENTIFSIFYEKLAQKSSVFIKSMKLFIICVFNTCLKYCVHRKYHIMVSWSEILIFVIFRKKLAQKSSVLVK